MPWLFVSSIFASAFPIFGVQPMVGRHVLPWFGGVPSVGPPFPRVSCHRAPEGTGSTASDARDSHVLGLLGG